jgi:Reverse transcriptase (RNA-dependent DNA polymerase)
MVIDELIRRLSNAGLWPQGFADDISIVITGKCLSTVSELMQNALNIVQAWCREVGLTGSSNKTNIILFTNKINTTGMKNLELFGKR